VLQLDGEVVVLGPEFVFVERLQLELNLGLELFVHVFLEPDGDVRLLANLN